MRKQSINFFLVICALILVAVPLISGCTPKEEEKEHVKVTYKLGVLFFPATQNPFAAKSGKADISALNLVYEPLLYVGLDGTLIPWLAESWSFDKATSMCTVKLDNKAKWSDGTALTAEDVKFSYEKYWEISHAQGIPTKDMVESITVVDTNTVKFKLKQALVAFTELLQGLFIAPKHIWSGVTDVVAKNNTNPVGSGPYFWTEWVTGSHCILQKNPNYWKAEVPIDEIVFKLYGTAEVQLLALQNGDVDAVADLDIQTAVPSLVKDPNIDVNFSELNFTQRLYLNLRVEPFNIKEFRNALNILFNRWKMCDTVLFGYGLLPQQVPLAPVMSDAVPELKWPHRSKTQAERAQLTNDMLDKIPGMSVKPAGTPPANWVRTYNGTPLNFELIYTTTPSSAQVGAILIEDANSVGIKFTVKMITAQALNTLMFRHEGNNPLGWKVALFGTPRTPSIDKFAVEWCGNPVNWTLDSTVIGWTNTAIQQKLNDSRYEWDVTKRAQLIKDAQILMAEEQPEICLYHTITPGAFRVDKFSGWEKGGVVVFDYSINSRYAINSVLRLKPITK